MLSGKRKIRNFLIRPKQQIAELIPFLLILTVACLGFGLTFYYNIESILSDYLEVFHYPTAEAVDEALSEVLVFSGLQLFLYMIFMSLFIVLMGSRYFGAAYALERYLKSLRETGSSDRPLKLRRSDRLKDIARLLPLVEQEKNRRRQQGQ